jgi:hypothetical protein
MKMQVTAFDSTEARKKRNAFWAFLRRVKGEFERNPELYTIVTITEYILTQYGIKCIMDASGNFTDGYIVEDKEKYFLAKLTGLL